MLKLLDLQNVKENKAYFISRIIFSLLFSISTIGSMLTIFSGSIFDGIEKNNIKDLEPIHLFYFILIFIAVFIVISLIGKIIFIVDRNFYKENKKVSKKTFFIIFFAIIIMWLPYILSYFPGGVFGDTNWTILQALGKQPLSNNHPLLYMATFKVFTGIALIFQNFNLLIAMYTIFQICLMAGVISYIIYSLYKKNVNKFVIILLTAFFGLYKIFPLYAITIWKDTLYGILVLLFTFEIVRIVTSNKDILTNIKEIILYALILFAVAFARSNGLYAAVATTIVIYIWIITNKKQKILKKFIITTIIEIITFFIIIGPIFNSIGLNAEFSEAIAIPLQQMSYVISTDGNITEEEREYINNLLPEEIIKEEYKPCYVDFIKYNRYFSRKYLNAHKSEFLKVYIGVLTKNFKDCIKAHLLNTLSYWNMFVTSPHGANVSPTTDHDTYVFFKDVKQHNYIEEITGKSIRKELVPHYNVSPAVFEFIMMLSAVYVFKIKKNKNILIYMPVLFTLATILITVPMAFSLRYMFSAVIVLPFSLIFPFLGKN